MPKEEPKKDWTVIYCDGNYSLLHTSQPIPEGCKETNRYGTRQEIVDWIDKNKLKGR